MTNVSAKSPWWRTARTVRQGLVMGTVWVALGVLGLLVAQNTGFRVVSAMWLMIGVVYLATAAALRHREHPARQSGREK